MHCTLSTSNLSIARATTLHLHFIETTKSSSLKAMRPNYYVTPVGSIFWWFFWAMSAFEPIRLLWILNSPAVVETHKRPIDYLAQISSRLGLFVFLIWFLFVKGKWAMAGLGFCGSRDFQCFGKSHNDPIWNLIYAGETRREKVANFNPPAGGKFWRSKILLVPT